MANQTASASLTPGPIIPKMEDPGPLGAAHTPNFPALLRRLGASLLVTTYQAGKLVMVRGEGDQLNTHYRSLPIPLPLSSRRAAGLAGTSALIGRRHRGGRGCPHSCNTDP